MARDETCYSKKLAKEAALLADVPHEELIVDCFALALPLPLPLHTEINLD